jgi:ATP-dependent Lon protease
MVKSNSFGNIQAIVGDNKNMKNKLKKNKEDSDDDSEDDYETETSIDSDDFETITESDDDDDDSSYHPVSKKSKQFLKKKMENSDDDDSEEESEEEEKKDKKSSKTFSKKNDKVDKKDDKKEEKKEEKKHDKKVKSDDKKSDNNKNKKHKSHNSSNKKHQKKSSNKYNESEDDESEYYDDDEDDVDIYSEKRKSKMSDEKGLYSIILAMDGEGDYEGEDDEYTYNEEDEAECNSEDEEAFMKEKYEKVEPLVESEEIVKKVKKNKEKKKKEKKIEPTDEVEFTDVEQEYLELVETKKYLMEQLIKKPKSKVLKNAVSECNDSIKKLIKKARTKNAKTYHKLIHDDKKKTNEVDYFKKKLSNKQQLRIMKDLKEINKHINIEKPYRLRLLDSKMPPNFKAIALQKLNILRTMEPGDNEYYKIKNWVDTFMRIPFGINKSLSIKMEDGIDSCNEFMENAKKTLDDCTYGLNDAKMQIMQFLGQWIANPSAMGSAIAINGPMGTGKTSVVKEGISKILGREFAFIALGGAGDSSFLEGHSYTYEGSSWGRIVQILIDSKCMNPIIYFDELDKVSDTPRGEEIIGVLTHLTDTSQNSQYHDKYFSEIDFDLSKCLFIFSYNDESKVNPILRDRMYRIQTKGYETKEKVVIARDYLLPKIREQVNFTKEEVIIPDETIQYIITNGTLTKEEAGVRNLKRCLEIIHTKLNLFRLVKPESELFGKDMTMKVTFPFTVTTKDVDILIKNEEKQNQSLLAMYV